MHTLCACTDQKLAQQGQKKARACSTRSPLFASLRERFLVTHTCTNDTYVCINIAGFAHSAVSNEEERGKREIAQIVKNCWASIGTFPCLSLCTQSAQAAAQIAQIGERKRPKPLLYKPTPTNILSLSLCNVQCRTKVQRRTEVERRTEILRRTECPNWERLPCCCPPSIGSVNNLANLAWRKVIAG